MHEQSCHLQTVYPVRRGFVGGAAVASRTQAQLLHSLRYIRSCADLGEEVRVEPVFARSLTVHKAVKPRMVGVHSVETKQRRAVTTSDGVEFFWKEPSARWESEAAHGGQAEFIRTPTHIRGLDKHVPTTVVLWPMRPSVHTGAFRDAVGSRRPHEISTRSLYVAAVADREAATGVRVTRDVMGTDEHWGTTVVNRDTDQTNPVPFEETRDEAEQTQEDALRASLWLQQMRS